MGVAYSANIDLDSVLDSADKSNESVSKLNEKLKQLESTMQGSLGKLSAIGSAVSDKLGAALENLPYKKVEEGMGSMKLTGVVAFNAITKLVELFGHALNKALGIFRLILIVASMLAKMNPFAWLKKALSWVVDLGKKVSELAKGQLSDSRKAKELNMSISQYKNFEKAGKISGTDYILDDAEATRKAMLDSQKGGAFASTIGISQEWARRANAVELMEAVTNKIYDKLAEHGGDAQSQGFTSFMSALRDNAGIDLSYLDPAYLNAVSRDQNNQFFSELRALVSKDKVDYNALQKLDRQNMKTSAAWDNVLNTALSKLAPLFTQLSKEAEKLFDIFAKWIGSGKFQKVIDALEAAIISMIQWVIDLINKWAPEGWLPEELKDWNMEMTKKKEEKALAPMKNFQATTLDNSQAVENAMTKLGIKDKALLKQGALGRGGYIDKAQSMVAGNNYLREGKHFEKVFADEIKNAVKYFDNRISDDKILELSKAVKESKERGLDNIKIVGDKNEIKLEARDRHNKLIKSVVIASMQQ